MLDNVAHIKAYWVMLGKNLAQIALRFGADDLDGTINEGGSLMESYLAEGNENQLTKLGIEEMVRGAGRIPMERDTLYHPITSSQRSPQLKPSQPTLRVLD
jgi:aminodeoxyfutalosine synthase